LCERAFPVSLELPVKAIYGGRNFHNERSSDERFGWGISQLHSANKKGTVSPIWTPHLATGALFGEDKQ
jgi:hypothetical protein